ncbi:tRNA (adenine-N1)-methyltransferase [Yaniella flava]|uniref:tRNA (Adenine-N1)-methyltransferase n=1 Tax=Yaniella flava TaxID=287930 RepID=A0ABP5G2L8_9MICC|nr:tRNA (adenine-N1)-methyltransferase [Micrococcaceae bacterium]
MTTSGDQNPPIGALSRRGPLRSGERVQLTDERGKLHTITLLTGESFHTQHGVLHHDALIGGPEGVVVENTHGFEYQVLRPLISDYVLSMPRGATVIYPKDTGQIIHMADIFPGARVVEAGVGSGGLSISLLRAVGEQGNVYSYERRADFAEIAEANVTTFFGARHPAFSITLGDVQDEAKRAHEPGSIDRIIFDMLAPWEAIDTVAELLAPGGVWLNYVATATQLSRIHEAIRDDGRFTAAEASETMVRGWHLDGLAVRPQHRMVGHTGFLLMTRRLALGQEGLELRRRIKTFAQEDMDIWTPNDETHWQPEKLGHREPTTKRAKKAVRQSKAQAQRAVESLETERTAKNSQPDDQNFT